MATDATGTPTSLGIRKYNTSADAPSGLGFNGAMDDIDALLLARVPKTLLTTTGDLVYASGVSTPARLGIGTTGQILAVSGGIPVWSSNGVYAAFTPVWTASGTQPVLGNGALSGRWTQIGKQVHYYGSLVMGSTTTYGTGSYLISMPVTPAASMNGITMGSALLLDSSAGAASFPVVRYTSIATFEAISTNVFNSNYTGFGAVSPYTLAVNDTFNWNFVYEAA
jgi:hypothetical protein